MVLCTKPTGAAAVEVKIRAYDATGELDNITDPSILGTRVLLTCDVTGLPGGNEMISYRWSSNCTGRPNSSCEIRDGDPYYRVLNDILLVDVISQDQGGRYHCTVHYQQKTERHITHELSVAG